LLESCSIIQDKTIYCNQRNYVLFYTIETSECSLLNRKFTTKDIEHCNCSSYHFTVNLRKFSPLISDVTLSHLRSKEFQRIHLPCILQHRESSQCTPVYIEMYLGKWLHFQRSKPLSSKPWYVDEVFFIQAQTIINCGNKSMLMWWIQVLQEEVLKWRNFGVLAILKVRKYYWKVRTSLTAHSQAFQHVFEYRHAMRKSRTSDCSRAE